MDLSRTQKWWCTSLRRNQTCNFFCNKIRQHLPARRVENMFLSQELGLGSLFFRLRLMLLYVGISRYQETKQTLGTQK